MKHVIRDTIQIWKGAISDSPQWHPDVSPMEPMSVPNGPIFD